jgi:hypothetical protein
MRTSELPTEQEIMRCIVDSGPIAGQHLAALERQKWALAVAERHAALKANPAVAAARVAKRQTPNGIQNRLSHWLGVRLISAGHRLTGSTA